MTPQQHIDAMKIRQSTNSDLLFNAIIINLDNKSRAKREQAINQLGTEIANPDTILSNEQCISALDKLSGRLVLETPTHKGMACLILSDAVCNAERFGLGNARREKYGHQIAQSAVSTDYMENKAAFKALSAIVTDDSIDLPQHEARYYADQLAISAPKVAYHQDKETEITSFVDLLNTSMSEFKKLSMPKAELVMNAFTQTLFGIKFPRPLALISQVEYKAENGFVRKPN